LKDEIMAYFKAFTLRNSILPSNTVVIEPEGSTSLIPKPATGHDPKLVPSSNPWLQYTQHRLVTGDARNCSILPSELLRDENRVTVNISTIVPSHSFQNLLSSCLIS